MLKSKNLRFISLLAAVCLLVGAATVFAKQNEELIKVLYNDIKIQIDGVTYEPKDANGYPVEPFIYNGTTYLPVRGIANAFGAEVNWSPETMTVSLGKNKFEWLDQLGYVDYYKDDNSYSFGIYSDDTFGRAVMGKINLQSAPNLENGDTVKQKVTYNIAKKYDKLYAMLGSTGDRNRPVTLKIYGDHNKVLYMMSATKESKPIDITVDVAGHDFLYFETSGTLDGWAIRSDGNIILGNARFSLAE